MGNQSECEGKQCTRAQPIHRAKVDIAGHADSREAFWVYKQQFSLKKVDFKTPNEVLLGPCWAWGKPAQPGRTFGQEVSSAGSQSGDRPVPSKAAVRPDSFAGTSKTCWANRSTPRPLAWLQQHLVSEHLFLKGNVFQLS